jgi:hypothetical protein
MPTQKKISLPERNIVAEIFIQVGAMGILVYVVIALLFSFVANAFNDTGSETVFPVTLLVFLFCINLTVQAVRLLRESNRVDHYIQRIVAICLILLLPIVVIAYQIVVISLSASATRSIGVTSSVAQIFNITMAASAILGLVGSIGLWVLLVDKNKLVWILKSSNTRSREYKQTKEKIAKNKKLGLIFLLAPVVLFALSMFVTIFVGSMGNAGAPFWLVLLPLRQLLSYLWLPSVIVGVVLLAKRK